MFRTSLFLVLLFSSSLFANNDLTDYRKHGTQNIEKQMDIELTMLTYWSQYLQSQDTTFGYIEGYSSILA